MKTLHERIQLSEFNKLPSIPQIAKVNCLAWLEHTQQSLCQCISGSVGMCWVVSGCVGQCLAVLGGVGQHWDVLGSVAAVSILHWVPGLSGQGALGWCCVLALLLVSC